MAFHLKITPESEQRPRLTLARRLGMSLAVVAVALCAMIVGDDLLAGGRFRSLLVDDAVSGVLKNVLP